MRNVQFPAQGVCARQVGAPEWSSLRPQRGAVADAVRLVGGGAQFLVSELLVVGDVAVEEADLAVALERQE
jgi:hypothetical protein